MQESLTQIEKGDEALDKARLAVVDFVKNNPYDESSVNDFLRKIEGMKDRGELGEADYFRQVIELYSELFLNEQERLMTEEGKTEEQALEENHWAIDTEETLHEITIEAKRREGEEGMPEIFNMAKVRANTIWPQNNN